MHTTESNHRLLSNFKREVNMIKKVINKFTDDVELIDGLDIVIKMIITSSIPLYTYHIFRYNETLIMYVALPVTFIYGVYVMYKTLDFDYRHGGFMFKLFSLIDKYNNISNKDRSHSKEVDKTIEVLNKGRKFIESATK